MNCNLGHFHESWRKSLGQHALLHPWWIREGVSLSHVQGEKHEEHPHSVCFQEGRQTRKEANRKAGLTNEGVSFKQDL